MYCIGLTGRLASGKSTVAHFFSTLGIEVINADHVAKLLTAKDQPAFKQIIQHFGPQILSTEGELDRRQLREIIFTHPEERHWLEHLLHPLIRTNIETLVNKCRSPYCVIEIPLLTQRRDYPYLNRVLFITAPPTLQIARASTRDKQSPEHASTILASQPSEEQYRALADDIVVNDGSLHDLEQTILTLHTTYLCEANKK